jgi:hypothetical protein
MFEFLEHGATTNNPYYAYKLDLLRRMIELTASFSRK